MAEYVKKVLVFDEIAEGYAVFGKKISGVLKIEKRDGLCRAEVFLTDLLRRRVDGIECVLKVEKDVYHFFAQSAEFCFDLKDARQHDGVSCLLAAVKGDGSVPFAYAADVDEDKGVLLPYLKNPVQEETQYEKFVAATDNFYEQSLDLDKIRKESQARFDPVERLAGIKSAGQSFFAEVRDVLKDIFALYPPCEDLNDMIKESFWVKVPYRNGKYFAVGLIQSGGKAKYLAYAVPGDRQKRPQDDSFVFLPTKNNSEGYWIICQDASDGKCASNASL